MHFRNGRPANNGDPIVKLETNSGKIVAFGVLHGATPGNDFCNGNIAPIINDSMACMCDCIHVDDLASVIEDAGLGSRPDAQRPPHVMRMQMELLSLNNKRSALAKFIEGDARFIALPDTERSLMERQLAAMTEYAALLMERIGGAVTLGAAGS